MGRQIDREQAREIVFKETWEIVKNIEWEEKRVKIVIGMWVAFRGNPVGKAILLMCHKILSKIFYHRSFNTPTSFLFFYLTLCDLFADSALITTVKCLVLIRR